MRLLLINPEFPDSIWGFSWLINKVAVTKKAIQPPLGLATLAALTPSHWEITIVDENVEPIDWDFDADIVGVGGMVVQFARQRRILNHFRRKGCYVVAGSSWASICPEAYTHLADTIISGEAEYTWPQFCADFEKGIPKKHYQEKGVVDLQDSPAPRWDLMKLDRYFYASIQFSRGCPFRCEFCDIIVMFGRKPRTKTLEQIQSELDLLRYSGIRNVNFVDDNLIGHIPKAKHLLSFLIDYQKKNNFKFSFAAEATINMAEDEHLMSLLKRANYTWIFIGIETPKKESLRETKKNQNTRRELSESLTIVYSYGIDVWAGFIVGFDADDTSIFELQYEFITMEGITCSMVGLLLALPNTPLFKRLNKEGRLRPSYALDQTSTSTNIVPLNMTYEELTHGYRELWASLTTDETIFRIIRNKHRLLKSPNMPFTVSPGRALLLYIRFIVNGIIKGGFKRSYYFVSSILMNVNHPSRIPIIITNWMWAVSIKEFANKNIIQSDVPTKWVRMAKPLRTTGMVKNALG